MEGLHFQKRLADPSVTNLFYEKKILRGKFGAGKIPAIASNWSPYNTKAITIPFKYNTEEQQNSRFQSNHVKYGLLQTQNHPKLRLFSPT